jgi:hypothetical protein
MNTEIGEIDIRNSIGIICSRIVNQNILDVNLNYFENSGAILTQAFVVLLSHSRII